LAAQLPQADEAFRRGDYAAARAGYERVLAADSLNEHALFRLATLDSWDGKLARSLLRFDRLRRLDPNDEDVRVAQAQVLAWAGHTAVSLVLYDSVLARSPGRVDALAGRARVVAWRGDLERAERLWRAALAAHPDAAELLIGLAQTLYWKDQPALAEAYAARGRAAGSARRRPRPHAAHRATRARSPSSTLRSRERRLQPHAVRRNGGADASGPHSRRRRFELRRVAGTRLVDLRGRRRRVALRRQPPRFGRRFGAGARTTSWRLSARLRPPPALRRRWAREPRRSGIGRSGYGSAKGCRAAPVPSARSRRTACACSRGGSAPTARRIAAAWGGKLRSMSRRPVVVRASSVTRRSVALGRRRTRPRSYSLSTT